MLNFSLFFGPARMDGVTSSGRTKFFLTWQELIKIEYSGAEYLVTDRGDQIQDF